VYAKQGVFGCFCFDFVLVLVPVFHFRTYKLNMVQSNKQTDSTTWKQLHLFGFTVWFCVTILMLSSSVEKPTDTNNRRKAHLSATSKHVVEDQVQLAVEAQAHVKHPLIPLQNGVIINSKQKRWAVVQVFDCLRPTYSVGILGTNEAMQKWRNDYLNATISHVVIGWRCQCSTRSNEFPGATVHESIATMIALGIEFYPSEDIFPTSSVLAILRTRGARSINDLHKLFTDGLRSFRQFGGKFSMWNLTQYDRLLYMDHDVVPMQDLSHLFHEADVRATLTSCARPIMATFDPEVGYCMNSGVMVITPSSSHLENMLLELATAAVEFDTTTRRITACNSGDRFANGRKLHSDQDFIQNYFQSKQCFQSITPFYNVMVIMTKGDLRNDAYKFGFFEWLISRPETRNLLQAFHVGYPKPDQVNWKGPADQRFFDPPTNEKLSETQQAVLSIFKTYWMRFYNATDRVCAAIATANFAETAFSHVNVEEGTCSNTYRKVFHESGKKGIIQRCQGTKYNRSITNHGAPFREFIQSFAEDTRIPLWHDML